MSRISKISIILPVFNEDMNLVPFYHALKPHLAALHHYEWEIFFVDDRSTDHSLQKIIELRETDPRIKILPLPRNVGSHAALAAGLAQCSGDAAVLMSVDLQDPPSIIREFIAEWEKGAQAVWGTRRSRRDPWLRKIFTRVFYWLLRKTALPGYPEGGLDCCLLSRPVIDRVNEFKIEKTSLFALIFSLKFRQAFVPYDRAARAGGVSKFSFLRLVKMGMDILSSFSGGEYKTRARA